jgi:FdhD protein
VSVIRWRGEQPAKGTKDPAVDDSIAVELPVALTYNRVSHVVMMATPTDLEDFAVGFSITEGLVGGSEDILSIRIIPRSGGIELAMTITEEWFDRLATHRRNMAGRTGCGLCGAENIEQALRSPGAVSNEVSVSQAALQQAVSELEAHQPLQAETGASHGAAWCGQDGAIIQLREDVGRHNALDKLIGSLLSGRNRADHGGFRSDQPRGRICGTVRCQPGRVRTTRQAQYLHLPGPDNRVSKSLCRKFNNWQKWPTRLRIISVSTTMPWTGLSII